MRDADVAAAREAMLDWIETHWEALAALAWQGYVTEGRGIVLLQGDWRGEVVAAYQTAATALHTDIWWPDELVVAVQDYSPVTDIIFVVQHERTATVLGCGRSGEAWTGISSGCSSQTAWRAGWRASRRSSFCCTVPMSSVARHPVWLADALTDADGDAELPAGRDALRWDEPHALRAADLCAVRTLPAGAGSGAKPSPGGGGVHERRAAGARRPGAEREGTTPYDGSVVEHEQHGRACSFEAVLRKYNLRDGPALALLGTIINGADTDNSLWRQPEGPGLHAIADGFRRLGFADDHAANAARIAYDALLCLLWGTGSSGKAPLGVQGRAGAMRQTILFVCPHNAAKRVSAATSFQELADRRGRPLPAISTGTVPSRAVSLAVVEASRREGIDVAGYQPRRVTWEELGTATRVISLGCDVRDVGGAVAAVEQWNDVPSPSTEPHAASGAIRARAQRLLMEVQAADSMMWDEGRAEAWRR